MQIWIICVVFILTVAGRQYSAPRALSSKTRVSPMTTERSQKRGSSQAGSGAAGSAKESSGRWSKPEWDWKRPAHLKLGCIGITHQIPGLKKLSWSRFQPAPRDPVSSPPCPLCLVLFSGTLLISCQMVSGSSVSCQKANSFRRIWGLQNWIVRARKSLESLEKRMLWVEPGLHSQLMREL